MPPELLIELSRWCEAHARQLKACYLQVPVGLIRVFIITTAAKFSFELGEAIAALELNLARAGWRISISQLPDADADSLATFFNPDGALEVYAQRVAAPVQG